MSSDLSGADGSLLPSEPSENEFSNHSPTEAPLIDACEATELQDNVDGGTIVNDGLPAKFIIPDEGDDELLDEQEMDVEGGMAISIRRPGKHEFFKLNLASLFITHMLLHKPNPEAMDESLLYVPKGLRGRLTQDLRPVRFYLCHSNSSGRFFIWPVKVSDTDWYHSLEVLFRKQPDFFLGNAVRIKADKEIGRYRIYANPDPKAVEWPTRPMAELVTEAIGHHNIIDSATHPIYVELTSGEELK